MCDNEKCKAELGSLPGKNLSYLGKIKCRAKIIDMYPNEEQIRRFHIYPDLTEYLEEKTYIDEWGYYTEITRLKKDKK